MPAADHLCPAAIKAGVNVKPGQRFGFHNLRHLLSGLLITGQKSDVRTTQDILRHSSSTTAIDLYTQLHTIATGPENCCAGVGAQRDSKTADP
jgi:integrase